MSGLRLQQLNSTFSICRGSPAAVWVPPPDAEFVSLTRSHTELSIICPDDVAPEWPQVSGGWRCLRVDERHEVQTPGVLLSVVQPISEAGISVFAVATFETDHVLVPADELTQVIGLLTAAGHACYPTTQCGRHG